MSYNGSGTFVINTAGQPVVSGTVISSTAFNALTADLATGLSTAITKDGQTTPTANIPMGNNKITGLAVGTAATDAANLSQVQSTAAKLVGSVSGVDTITGTMSPTLAAYAAGQMFYFVAAGDNTGAVTLNLDGLGAKAVTRDGSVALAAGDIKSGEVVVVVYDGTRFQVVSQLNSAGNATFANVSITSALNVGGVATFTGGTANGVLYLNGSKVATSGSALTFNGTALAVTGTANSVDINPTTGNPNIPLRENNVFRGYIEANSGGLLFGVGASATEGMRLTTTGLGIGTSSPAVKLDVQTASAVGGITLTATTGTNGAAINCVNTGGSSYFGRNNSSGGAFGGAAYATVVYSGGAYPMSFYTNDIERARITAAGELCVATSTPILNSANRGNITIGGSASSLLFLGTGTTTGTYIYHDQSNSNVEFWNGANGAIVFGTNNAERARITSGGFFKASNTGTYNGATGSYHELRTNVNDGNIAILTHNGANQAQYGISIRTANDQNDATRDFWECLGGGVLRGRLLTNGGLANYSASNVNLASDERLKKDISPLDSAWGKIKSMEVVNFRYKDCNEGDPLLYGVIAQQVQPIVPELVVVTREATETDPEYYGIREQPMYWLAIKALQEAMTKIETLEAKVAALEAK